MTSDPTPDATVPDTTLTDTTVPAATTPDRAESDPIAGDPVAGDQASGDPAAGDQASGDPAAGDPAAGDPAAGDPAAGDLAAGDQASGAPVAGDQTAGAPGAGAPVGGDQAAGGPRELDPLQADEATEELRACPTCGSTTGSGAFCEACGAQVEHAPVADERSGGMLVLGAPPPSDAEPASAAGGDQPRCDCGGTFMDGYCEQCGSPQPDPRDHTEDDAASWVAGVCDVGIQHRSNQDAMALAVDGDRAALVVCDGVSSALRSEEASQAAADAAVAVLDRATSTGVGVASAVVPALSSRLDDAADAAADAVAAVTERVHEEVTDGAVGSHHNPSCTFVAAAIEDGHVVVGSVGDSRAYWFADDGTATRLTRDDSVAEERVDLGVPRAQAESGPGSHTITRWLGIDSPDHRPRTSSLEVEGPGWLILCSDGLWNYASEPDALAEVLAGVAAATAESVNEPDDEPDDATDAGPGTSDTGPAQHATHQPDTAAPDVQSSEAATGSGLASPGAPAAVTPIALARGLVTWAKARGGHDNITVIAARLTGERKAPTHG